MTATILASQRNVNSLLAGRLAIDPTKLGATGKGPTFTPETLHLLPVADLPPCTTCGGSGIRLRSSRRVAQFPDRVEQYDSSIPCPDCKGQRYPIGERITIAVECAWCKGTGLAGVNNSGHKVGCYSCVSTGQRVVATALLEAVLLIEDIESLESLRPPKWGGPYVAMTSFSPDLFLAPLANSPATDISSLLPHADWSSSHALRLTGLEVVG